MKIAGKWVPTEPTEEMLDASLDPWDKPTEAKPEQSHPYQRSIYAAMLAAAPQPDLEVMVEGCAREIFECQNGPWDFCSDEGKEVCRTEARAVLRHLFGGST